MLDLHERRYATVGAAHEAGVPIYVGTDAGGSLPHGLVAQRDGRADQGGSARTSRSSRPRRWGAREWLGRPGLVEGADADLVVYAADPRDDVTVVADPLGCRPARSRCPLTARPDRPPTASR